MNRTSMQGKLWRRTTRTLGVLAVLVMLLALGVSVSMAQGDAPTGVDAPLGKSSIGDTVFNDFNVDGDEDSGETGIPNVKVHLYKDQNGNGTLEASDYLSPTTTNNAGYYDFQVDGDEKYWVVLDPTNFDPGGALEDYIFTTGNTIGGVPTPLGIAYYKEMPLNQLDFNDADFGLVKVDLRISLSPGAATNIVGDPHVFTATVQSKIGNGTWTNVSGATPSVTYTPVPGTPGTSPVNCGPTNANGQCTVTINSNTPGVFTASATVTTNVIVNIPADAFGTLTPTPISRTRTTGGTNNTAASGSGPATKTYVDLRIKLNPLTATNAVNQSHTYTATVEQNTGTGGWANVPDNTQVTFSVSSALTGVQLSNCNTTNGQCTVNVNSAVADVLTIQASSTVNVGGKVITRTTGVPPNTTNGGTGNATKTYVDLRISISPLSDTNAVNDSHTFTVKVEQRSGTGAWIALAGVSPVVSISPAPSSITNNCDGSPVTDVTDANGNCTVVINSTTAAVYTANASITASVGGQSMTRNTNSTAGTAYTYNNTALAQSPARTGTATKTYVDLRISIDPLSDTNAVNQSHTFTVKVEQRIGNGGWTAVAGVSPVVSISPAPSSITNNCDGSPVTDVTDANGNCTVVINSTTAKVYTANARITTSVSGQSITRNTDSTAGNDYTYNNTALAQSPARTGTATKTYVDLRISIDPQSDTNPVNQSHDFTVKVEEKIGDGPWTAVSLVTPSVSVTPGPSTPPGGCGPTNSQGECTITINSNAAGTFTANASLTRSVLGQVMTRNTNSTAGNDYTYNQTALAQSPARTGTATKIYVDLRIQIGPPTAINSVNDPHTFTITVTQNLGNGSWIAVANGTKPAVIVNPSPNGGVTDNCAAAGTTAGVCTVVINSSVVNVFSINASLTNFAVSGQSLSRSTNSTAGAAYSGNIAAGGSGTATKTYVAGSIGDFVWWDIDKDGNQDGGEPGIGDVTVFLYGTANGTGPTIATTTTLANGYYVFPGLGTGTYSVRIDPAEFTAGTLQDWNGSPANVGGAPNDALDSDADPVTHLIQSISINPVSGGLLQNNPTNDFGFYKNSSHTVTKTRITDPTGDGMRIGELITFTVSVQNTGKTWLDVVPISDTYDSLYIEFVRASISGVNTPPDATVSQVGSTFGTKHWHDITGSGSLGPGATIVLHVVFQGVGDTTELGGGAGKPPLQLPCAQVGFTCNQVSTSKPGGTEGPTVDPDGPTGPLPPLETIPPQKDDEPAKVVNPTAIALADYGADVTQTSVTVRWTTVNESEIRGFNVYRIDNARNSLLVGYVEAAKPGQPSGSTYSLTDSNAVYGASYVYILEAQLFSGGKNTETLANTSWLWLANIVR